MPEISIINPIETALIRGRFFLFLYRGTVFEMELANVVGYILCAVKCCEARWASPSLKRSRRGGVGCKGSSGFRKLFSAKVCRPVPWSVSISVSPLFYRVEMRFWSKKGGRKNFYKIRLEGLTYTTLCAIINLSI